MKKVNINKEAVTYETIFKEYEVDILREYGNLDDILQKTYAYLKDRLSDFDQFIERKRNQFLDAEVAQRLQDKIWLEPSIENLAQLKSPDTYTNGSASLLNTDYLIQLIKDFGLFKDVPADGIYKFDRRSTLLGKRILLCCSLTNLIYLPYDSRSVIPHPSYDAVLDGLTSKSHKELRIFDIKFGTTEQEPYVPVNWLDLRTEVSSDSRYTLFHEKDGDGNDLPLYKQIFDLGSNDTWKNYFCYLPGLWCISFCF